MALTFEQWKEEYISDRPAEPYSESDNAEQWAKIAFFMEDNLQKAFEVGYQSCMKDYGWHYLKDGDMPPNDEKEYLFYLASKGERGMVVSDTWDRKRNNQYVIAWAEFQMPQGFLEEI